MDNHGLTMFCVHKEGQNEIGCNRRFKFVEAWLA